MSKRHQHNLFLSLDSLIPDNHPYRQLDDLISFSELSALTIPYTHPKVVKKKALSLVYEP